MSGFQKSVRLWINVYLSCMPPPSPLQPLCWAKTGWLEGLCGQEGSALLGGPCSCSPSIPSLLPLPSPALLSLLPPSFLTHSPPPVLRRWAHILSSWKACPAVPIWTDLFPSVVDTPYSGPIVPALSTHTFVLPPPLEWGWDLCPASSHRRWQR